MASAAWDHPDAPARKTIFQAVGEQTIKNIIHEYKYSGSAYTLNVNTRMRASYRNHYRRMLPAILKALDIRSNNKDYRPIIDGIRVLKKYMISQIRYYPENEQISIEGVVPNAWKALVLDVLKEADLRINFTRRFKSVAQREIIEESTLRKRLLLILYALGTNAGVKRILAGNHGEKYHDLIYVRRRFVHKEYLRQAIADVVNAILVARRPHIWGEATTACASDSKKFGAWIRTF
jgi:hypothetical protein